MGSKNKAKRLVIVESPAKARTIGRYLDPEYQVRASVGHVRDLPPRELGVDVEKGFQPRYVTIRGKGRILQELKREARDAAEIILATDPDREGEAIAFHVAEQLGYSAQPDQDAHRFRRVLFHEVTKNAVRKALEQPTAIDMRKVDAQQARRILDRLVGYQASPLLWKPIRPGLSAGRVQTVALRIIAEREVEIKAFKPQEYWSITAKLEHSDHQFEAKLNRIDDKGFRLESQDQASAVLADVRDRPFTVTRVRRRERSKNPPPPFTTSLLQQEAAKKLGFSARKTMVVAQQLYEGLDSGADSPGGLITYMRTDSTRVAPSAAEAARQWIAGNIGEQYLPARARLWPAKGQRSAQDAHEAIRPTDANNTPEKAARHLDRDQARLYELIWRRFMAAQMTPAIYDTTTVDFNITGASGKAYLFRATGSILKFDGFTRMFREARESGDARTLDDLVPLPPLKEKDHCRLHELVPAQHFTQPPPRFSEATLVKELERKGIGRPSTYAQIISTLQERKYVEVKEKRFHPTPLGETVLQILIRVFPQLFEVGFTSSMEDELDRIEDGALDWRSVLEGFYGPFREQLREGERKSDEILRDVVAADAGDCKECGRELRVRWNVHGRFLGCSGYPECRYTEQLPGEKRPEPRPTGEDCPRCGSGMVERQGKFGPFIACSNYPECRYTKPQTIPGIKCPRCGEGQVAEKRTRRGKPFWSCTRYPDCEWSSWDRLVPTPCPDCGAAFLYSKSKRSRGEYFKCQQCSGEFSPESVAPEVAEERKP